MKKNILKLVTLVVIGILGTSCSDDFLETVPTDAISSETAVATTKDAMASLNGIHRLMYDGGGSQSAAGLGSIMLRMEALGDDFVMTTTGNGWFNGDYKWIDHRNDKSWSSYYPYRLFYQVIDNANVLINNIDGAKGETAAKIEIKAQALTYRAFAHFNLVQMYGKRYVKGAANTQLGVAIMLESNTAGLARNTVEEVYTQVNKDLDEAIALFATVGERNNPSHLNINVAYGLKARVALTKGEYALASTNAKLARAGFTLMSTDDLIAGFNDYTNSEWIWGAHMQDDQSTYFATYFAYISYNFSSSNIRSNPKAVNSDLYAKLTDTDARKFWWDEDPAVINGAWDAEWPMPTKFGRQAYMNRKFAAASEANSIGDVPLMRAAEMYLIEAESEAKLNNDAAAQAALTPLALSRDASYTATNTGSALLTEIMTQRRLELWGEGFRWLDIKRLNVDLVRGANHKLTLCKILNVPSTSNEWEFMIPIEEINSNPALKGFQNPS